MMLRCTGCHEAAQRMLKGADVDTCSRRAPSQLARPMKSATEIESSEFANTILAHM